MAYPVGGASLTDNCPCGARRGGQLDSTSRATTGAMRGVRNSTTRRVFTTLFKLLRRDRHSINEIRYKYNF